MSVFNRHHPAKFSSQRTTLNGQPTIWASGLHYGRTDHFGEAFFNGRLSVNCCPMRTELGRMMRVVSRALVWPHVARRAAPTLVDLTPTLPSASSQGLQIQRLSVLNFGFRRARGTQEMSRMLS